MKKQRTMTQRTFIAKGIKVIVLVSVISLVPKPTFAQDAIERALMRVADSIKLMLTEDERPKTSAKAKSTKPPPTHYEIYDTRSVSEYAQLYSKKYTFIKTLLYTEARFIIEDEEITQSFEECKTWAIKKKVKTATGMKYVAEPQMCYPEVMNTMIVDKEFVTVYLNEGQQMLKFRIIKKERKKYDND